MSTFLRWLLLAQFFSVSLVAVEPVTAELIQARGLVSQGNLARLQAVLAKANRGEAITVAAVGGSITAGGQATKSAESRYVQRVSAWFRQTYPQAKVSFRNAGIGGTNSYYGALRLPEDVLAHQPDFVVVEYAVNNMADRPFAESYEGVLRQLLQAPQQIAVLELFFMHKNGENAQTWQEMLGRHYGLPMVSFRDAWWPELTAGRTPWEDLYADEVHPKDAGHLRASDLLIALLEQAKAAPLAIPLPRALPAPAISDLYAVPHFARYQKLQPALNVGWKPLPEGKGWQGTAVGQAVEFTFSGQILFLGLDFDQKPNVVFSIDGGKAQPLKADPHRRPFATGLAPGQHRVRIEIIAPSTGGIRCWAVGGAGL